MEQRDKHSEKAAFVDGIRAILVEADIIYDLEYRCFPDKYEELLKVTFAPNIYTYVNVTADSKLSIFVEIARVVNQQPAVGEIIDARHIETINRWWDK